MIEKTLNAGLSSRNQVLFCRPCKQPWRQIDTSCGANVVFTKWLHKNKRQRRTLAVLATSNDYHVLKIWFQARRPAATCNYGRVF